MCLCRYYTLVLKVKIPVYCRQMDEIWKDIEGYEGFYQVSNTGRVKSLQREVPVKNGLYRIKKESILRPFKTHNGYLSIILRNNKKSKNFLVHRLVAVAFIPNPEKKETVNHKNGVKDQNNVANLEWNTQRENLCHALQTHLRKPKKKSLSECQALAAITIMSVKKRSGASISRVFNVSKSTIDRIRKRETWKHIPWPNED